MTRALGGSFFFLSLLFTYPGTSQSISGPAGNVVSYILVVPFSPQMYKNPGDHLICKESDINPGELADMIRRSLASTMVTNLAEHYHTTEIQDKDIANPRSELSQFYRALGYRNRTRKLAAFHKGYPAFKLKQILGPRHLRWGSDCHSSDFQKPFGRHSYVQAVIKNDSLYKAIMRKNNAAFVVLVNQFEMNTRFKNCLDLQRSVYQRDMYVHFTLLDSSGKELRGGVVGTTFQSSTNDIQEIMEKNLGLLCGLIIDMVRKEI